MVKVIYKNSNDEIKELCYDDSSLIEAIVVAKELGGKVRID